MLDAEVVAAFVLICIKLLVWSYVIVMQLNTIILLNISVFVLLFI